MRLSKAIKCLLASLILPPLCTAQFLSIEEKFGNTHECIGRCLDSNYYNDVVKALSCGSPVDNACYCPTDTSSIGKATSFLASCATASCAAGDLERDEPFMLGMYATYCYEAGFTQPGLEPTETPSTATSDSPTSAEPSSTQLSAPKGSDSQPSMTEGNGSGAGTSTQMTIVTHTQDSDATKSQVIVQATSTIYVPGGGGGGGMSMEAKIGVGVAVPAVVLAVAGLSLFIWLRRRSRKRAAVDAAALAWQRRQQQEEEDRQTQGTEKTASQAAHISRKPVARTESLSVSATPTSSKGHELSGDDRSRFAELSNENTGPIRHEVGGQTFKKYEMQGSMHHGDQRHTNSPSELPGGR